jgi:hypothetical protein
MSDTKAFSVSSNGDRWSLETDADGMTVLHQANEPSGGHETRTSLPDFLEGHAGKPEHAALIQLLGQSTNKIDAQLAPSDDTDMASLKIAREYLRLGGRRVAKVDDNSVSVRLWEDDPSEAESFWQARVEPLGEKERRDIAIHLPSMSDT